MSNLFFAPIDDPENWTPVKNVVFDGLRVEEPEYEDLPSMTDFMTQRWSVEFKADKVDPLLVAIITGWKPKRKRDRKRWDRYKVAERKLRRADWKAHQRSAIGIYHV